MTNPNNAYNRTNRGMVDRSQNDAAARRSSNPFTPKLSLEKDANHQHDNAQKTHEPIAVLRTRV